MQVQINTDSNIEGNELLAQQVEAVVRGLLQRFRFECSEVELPLA